MLAFLFLALAGFAVLVFGWFFGHDHDIGHDIGHDADHGVDQEGVISVLSTRVIATFIMGFGAAGFVSSVRYNLSNLASSGIGVLSGLILAALMYLLLWIFSKQQGSSSYSMSSLINAEGTVSTGIDRNMRGEVCINAHKCYSSYIASSKDGNPISKGEFVKVVSVSGNELVVEKIR